MKSKIQNSKPDIASNQPLKAKSFPINLSMFQTSYTSSSSSKAYSPNNSVSQIQMRGSKISNMQPNLFQYNDRSPLMFSSDEDQPSFNYYEEMKETQKESILNATNDKINTENNKDKQKQQKKEQVKQEIPEKQEEEMEQKIQQVIINKIYINKSSGQFNNHKNQQLKPSISQNILQKQQKQEQAVKQKSQVLSKIDQIIGQVNFDQNKNILIEQSSNKSSQRHSSYIRQQSYQPTINRLSNQSTLPPRKRRNRIFDTNSKNRSSKQAYVTPQKGVQTQPNHNKVKEFDYSPQLKALDVLSKIVDQINPNPAKISQSNNFDWFLPFIDELQDIIKLFRNLRSIEQIGQSHKQKIRTMMNKIKQMRITLSKRSNQTKYYSQVEQSILNNFRQLTQQSESVEQVVHNAIETKHRLNNLLQGSKGLMIMLQRKELKKIYYILQQITVQTERLKQIKSTCGKYKLQNIFREYLQAEINQLQDMHASMAATFKDTFPHFNL